MKAWFVRTVTSVGLISLLTGCVSSNGRPYNTGTGALVGGATGATIGAVADRRNPGAGALIGGVAGLIAGGLVGHSVDQQEEARRRSIPPPQPVYVAPQPAPLPIADIKALSKGGVSDDNIILQINSTHAVYHLDSATIIDLSNSGVSQKVISFMINTASMTVSQPPPAPQVETWADSPGPDYVWVKGEWVWNGERWFWVSGRWSLGPRPNVAWVEPRWVRAPYGWRREPVYWR